MLPLAGGVEAIRTSVSPRSRYAAVKFGSAMISCCDRKSDELLSIGIPWDERDDYVRGIAVLKPLQSALQKLHDVFSVTLGKVVMDVGNALSSLLDVGGAVPKTVKRG